MTGLLAVAPAVAQSAVTGKVLTGEARPTGEASESRYARLTFEFEHCGAILRTTWYDAAGVMIATDELEEREQQLVRYRYWRPNVSEWASVIRHGATVRIDRSLQGQVRSDEFAAPANLAAGSMMALVAQRGLAAMAKGEVLDVRYAVPEELASYSFTLTLGTADNRGMRDVRVVPQSWLIRKFVHPVVLSFDAEGEFVRMQGRALPVSGEPSTPKPLELDAQVLARFTRSCSAVPQESPWQRMYHP